MTTYDGAWLDLMYNNRVRVPGSEQVFERWAKNSARVRESASCVLDMGYGDGPGESLDIFTTAGDAQALAPVLFFIHGGYWRALDKRDHSFIAPAFTRRGVCVVVPNYALCPAVTIPEITLQMVRALAWTWRRIARWGGDPGRIVVAGHSAGGQLAAMMLSCLWPQHAPDLPAGLVRGALAVSALHDLEPIMHTPFLQPSLRLTPRQVALCSPARLPAPAQGRLYSVVGGDESEEYLRQNRLIRECWGAGRVSVCEALPGLNHFGVLESLAQPGHRVHQLAMELLNDRGATSAGVRPRCPRPG